MGRVFYVWISKYYKKKLVKLRYKIVITKENDKFIGRVLYDSSENKKKLYEQGEIKYVIEATASENLVIIVRHSYDVVDNKYWEKFQYDFIGSLKSDIIINW